MNEKPKRIRVIESYVASYPDPLCVRAGEKLTLGKRDDEYPGWIWCTDAHGKSSWTPQSYLEIRGDSAILLRDYDARELTVSAGETLTVECEECGWLRCITESGERGWIPSKNVTPLYPPASGGKI